MLDDLNGSLSNINVKKIEKLDTRPTTYATDATRTDKLNAHLPYADQCDPNGRLSSVDIGECVHTCDDFLAELGRGAFGVVYLTKPTNEQPSVALKVVSPLKRYSSAHENQHLSKFKYCPYFVTVVTRSLKDWVLGPMRLECYAMKYDPNFTLLEFRRKVMRGDFCNPAHTQFYRVALADIALGLHYMHTAKLIHGDLKVDD